MDRYDLHPKSLREIIFDTLDIHSALLCAVRISNSRYVQRYIDKGADVNTPGHRTKTFYFDISLSGSDGMVKAFTENGSDIKIQITAGNTALHLASKMRNSEIAEELINGGADVKVQNIEGNTALHFASSTESSVIVETLLNAGSDVNVQDAWGLTPLHDASSFENIDIVDALIKAGSDIHLQDLTGRTALHLAAQFATTEILELLIKAGSNVNTLDKKRKTALHYASEYMNVRNVKTLTAKGADTNFQDINGNTALHLVLPEIETYDFDLSEIDTHPIIRYNNRSLPADDDSLSEHLDNVNQIAKLLIEAGVDVNKQGKHGNTALHLAMYLPNNIPLVNALIRGGADVDKHNVDNETALHFTDQSNDCNIVRLLIEKRIDVNKQNRIGNTALHLFSSSASNEIVQELIFAGTDVNKQNSFGKTALHLNIEGRCNYKILEVLIRYGAASIKDKHGLDPLQYMNHGGAFLNVFKLHNHFRLHRDVYGNTIFHLFIEKGNLKSQKKVWAYICDQQFIFLEYLCIQNMFGQTPLHVAASRKDDSEVALDLIFSNFDECNLNLFFEDENGNTFFHTFLSLIRPSVPDVKRNLLPFIKRLLEGEYKTCLKQNVKKLVQTKNKSGHTPLHILVNKTNELSKLSDIKLKHVLEFFIKAGADINSRTSLDETPLHSLIKLFWVQPEAIEFVLKSSADVNVQNVFGESPIFKAPLYNWPRSEYDASCLELLIKYGARTDICNKLGQTPIIVHMLELPEMFNSNVIQMFENKVDGNQQDNNKSNLLHYLAWATELEVNVSCFDIFNWSDFSVVPDSFGQLPCDVAYSMGHKRLLNELCVCKNGVHKDELVFCSRKILFESLIQKGDMFHKYVRSKCKYFSECTIRNIMNLPFVGLVKFDGEAKAVKIAVESVIKNICRIIGEKDELLTNTVILSGSVAENTKVGLPDEFDFICMLEKMSEFMEVEEIRDNKYIRLKLKEAFTGNTCRHFFDRDCYLEQAKLIDRLHDILQEIIHMPFIYTHSNIFLANDGLKRPEKSPNFKLTLRWCGSQYKNMMIKIDLVPSCRLKSPSSSKFLSQTATHKMHGNEDLLVLFQESQISKKEQGRVCMFYRYKRLIRVSQANAEKKILETLPQVAKDAYVVSKILCDDRICPSVIDVKHGSMQPTFSSIVSSYILKNCLFYVAEEISEETSPTVSLHDYVCRIFKKLYQCAQDGKLPCYIFPWQNIFTFPTFSDKTEHHSTCVSRAMYAKLILNILGIEQHFGDIAPTMNDRPDYLWYLNDPNLGIIPDYSYQSILDNEICANCKRKPGQYNFTLKPCSRCKVWTYCSVQCKKENWNRHRFACDYHFRQAMSNSTGVVCCVICSKRSNGVYPINSK